MNEKKLPILSIFLKALSLTKKRFRSLIKVSLPFIIIGTMLILSDSFLVGGSEKPIFSILFCIYFVAYFTALIMMFVGVHRVFLIEPCVAKKSGLFNWTGNEIKYLRCLVSIGGYAIFTFVFTDFLFSFLMSDLGDEIGISFIFLSWFAAFRAIYQWLLVLPSLAIGKEGYDFEWASEMTKGNSWRLMILIGVPCLLIIFFDSLLSGDYPAYFLLRGLIWFVVGIIQVGIISLSYAHLMRFDEN